MTYLAINNCPSSSCSSWFNRILLDDYYEDIPMYKTKKPYRPNTRKMYEEAHGPISKKLAVHHILPERLGGLHEVANLVALTKEEHIQAHLDLYETYGDVRDLCASYMLKGLSAEARKLAASKGGTQANINRIKTGRLTGTQLFDKNKRKRVATKAGRVGGAKQRDLKLGIHGLSLEESSKNASLGGKASCEVNGWKDPKVQSKNGKRGGVKNKGFKWYTDGSSSFKYTKAQQLEEDFDSFISRTHYRKGRK